MTEFNHQSETFPCSKIYNDDAPKETFTGRSKKSSEGNSDLAEAERLMTRLETMMQKAESFGGMFGGGKK